MVLGRARHAPRPLGTPPRASPLNRLAILTALVADGPPIARAVLGHESIASVPVLHVTDTAPNRHPVPKTFEMFERAGTAHVYRAEIDGLEHSHFVVHGGVVPFAGDNSPPAVAFWRGNAALSRIVLLFVEAFLADQVPAHAFAVRAGTIAADIARIFPSAAR